MKIYKNLEDEKKFPKKIFNKFDGDIFVNLSKKKEKLQEMLGNTSKLNFQTKKLIFGTIGCIYISFI